MAQIGDAEDEEKKFASLLKDQSIGTITIEQVLDLFKLPRQLGQFEDKVVTAAIGRFGPYVRHDGKFVSIKEVDGDDPFTITLERGVELVKEKREADAKKMIKTFEEDENVSVQEGRWGPYIKFGKQNVKIPKDIEAKDLTWDEVKALAEEAAKNPPKKRGKKK
jgi:DNA topoisomerase-1